MIFPDGQRYEVTGKVLTAPGQVRLEGHKWDPGTSRRNGMKPAKARFTIGTQEIVPIVKMVKDDDD